jgi:DNA primase
MPSSYPDHVIDRVREASDIVEVLSDYLRLKKRGRNYVCLCPFHHEKTPSFSVSQDKQIYHCFGCGKGGNVFSFLIEHEQMTFPEALVTLAKRANIALPEQKRGSGSDDRFERIYLANETAAQFFADSLHSGRNGEKVIEYLKAKRKLGDDIIAEFGIGYAPEGWDNLLAHARNKKITVEELFQAGLIVKRESGDGYYDRFRQRLTFPVFDFSRRVIGFGARALAAADSPKYLNTPETPLYNKSRVLYGLSHTRSEIRAGREVVIVEGYMDFLSLYQVGIHTAVAVSGTSFTKEHALLLHRFADAAILFFDGDAAGQSAAERCAERLFEVGIDVRVACPPPGEDPDSFVRDQGKEVVEQTLENASSYFRFVRETCDPPYSERSRSGQQSIIKSQLRLVSLAPDEVLRELLLKELSIVYDVSEAALRNSIEVESKPISAEIRPRYLAHPDRNQLERKILRLIVSHSELLDAAAANLDPALFSDTDFREIFNLAMLLREDGIPADFASLVGKLASDGSKSVLTSLIADEEEKGDWDKTFADYLASLKRASRDDRIRELTLRMIEASKRDDGSEADRILNEINKLRGEL